MLKEAGGRRQETGDHQVGFAVFNLIATVLCDAARLI
jgi:hypothetical protein